MDIFGSPPKLNGDNREIKEAIQSSRTALRETTQNVNAREVNIHITAESITQMLKRVDDWEKRLAEYAEQALAKQNSLREDQEKFLSQNEAENKQLDDEIRKQEELLQGLLNNCNEIKQNLKSIEDSKLNFNKNILELNRSVNDISTADAEHSNNITKASEKDVEFENQQESAYIEINRLKNKIETADSDIAKVQSTISDFNLKNAQNLAEITKTDFKVENLRQKIQNATSKYNESIESISKSIKSNDINNPKIKPTILQNQVTDIRNSMAKTIKSISENSSAEKIIKSNILQVKANAMTIKNNIKSINNEIENVRADHNRFLDNMVRIRTIKVNTISDIKTSLFEIQRSINENKQSLEEMAMMEARIAQRIRSTDVKIEICRADKDQIDTNEIELEKLSVMYENRDITQSSRVVALQDVYDALVNRIKGAEIEEAKLNRNFVSLVSQRPQEPESIEDMLYGALKKINKENRSIAKQIQKTNSQINDFKFEARKVEAAIKSKRANNPIITTKSTSPTKICYIQKEISNLISKVCEKKENNDYIKRRIQHKKQISHQIYNSTNFRKSFLDEDLDVKMHYGPSSSFNEKLTLYDLIWAIQSETYVWRSENTVFAKKLLLNTWNHQIDLFCSH